MTQVSAKTQIAKSRVGLKIGMLTINTWLGSDRHRRALYRCQCSCGKEHITTWVKIKKSRHPSCGCLRKQLIGESNTKHGHSPRSGSSHMYRVWTSMHRRCYRTTSTDFKYYGGKGITVSPEWHDFLTFLSDMGERPGIGFDIDRIDPEKGYSKANCRWLSHSENCRRAVVKRWNSQKAITTPFPE